MTTAVDSWCYVFGVVPAGARLNPPGTGLSNRLRLVECGDIAAVVGSPPTDRSLGRASDLLEHDRVLADLAAGGTPVLPMRFGAVLADEHAVVDELLAVHEQEFRAALDAVRDHVQYTVKVRYVEDVVLREVLADNPEIERLRRAGYGDDEATFERRLGLGELIVRALEARRPADAERLLDELGDAGEVSFRQLAAPEEVLDAAFLIPRRDAKGFERRVGSIARRHQARLQVRLVGPSPAYDFVGSG
ncbi:MAG TPA: GvpL/GvpF family gas vesicle protein [Jatrophihabitans sp.]|nr:GvpL/GvpF family gas vesicle protein [Jatrophihabitans sp.]